MADLYDRSVAALEEAGESVQARFRSHIECLVLFHAFRGELAFVAASEIRALEPEARARHIASRDRQQRVLDDIVEEGFEQGFFVRTARVLLAAPSLLCARGWRSGIDSVASFHPPISPMNTCF